MKTGRMELDVIASEGSDSGQSVIQVSTHRHRPPCLLTIPVSWRPQQVQPSGISKIPVESMSLGLVFSR